MPSAGRSKGAWIEVEPMIERGFAILRYSEWQEWTTANNQNCGISALNSSFSQAALRAAAFLTLIFTVNPARVVAIASASRPNFLILPHRGRGRPRSGPVRGGL